MQNTDKRVDAYIVRSADFAVPILEYLREVIHEACPGVRETMKWSFPNFDYNGSRLCSFASFKGHCAFGFWLGSKMKDPDGILEKGDRSSMGQLGRITSLKDLPPKKTLKKYIREAMSLIDAGVKIDKKVPDAKERNELEIPSYFQTALKKNKLAQSVFNKASYSFKKEYVQWITEAKSEETRLKRMNTALEWIEEGKGRNWKYERK
jgi:uncharacterized protein YdeI (YjbR/CyaY-like superfamily)